MCVPLQQQENHVITTLYFASGEEIQLPRLVPQTMPGV